MTDLEDVLTNLNKFKNSMKEGIEFIERIEELFGSWDAAADTGAELIDTSFNNLLDIINDFLIYGRGF